MNRAARRREAAALPKVLRKPVLRGTVPRLDITPEQLEHVGLTDKVRTGSVITIKGHRLNEARNGLERCATGHETPLRINIVPGGAA